MSHFLHDYIGALLAIGFYEVVEHCLVRHAHHVKKLEVWVIQPGSVALGILLGSFVIPYQALLNTHGAAEAVFWAIWVICLGLGVLSLLVVHSPFRGWRYFGYISAFTGGMAVALLLIHYALLTTAN